MINNAICNILENNFDDVNIQECFDEMFSGLSNSIKSGVFLSLLKLKEENIDDLLFGINSANSAIKKITLDADYNYLIQNICLDENSEYLDIKFAMDLLCSTCDIACAEVLLPNLIHKNNSYQILKALNIEINSLTYDNFENIKFLYSVLSEDSPYIKYSKDLISALPYKTILDKINFFINPFNIKNCTIGLSNKEKVQEYAKLCLDLGYINSIVFSSGDFPYVSIEKETLICEAWKNKIFSYTVSPELLGIKQNSLDSIKVESAEHSAEIIKAVFANKLKDAYYDVIIINSGLALYITKKVKSLMEGINLARKVIDDGKTNEMLLRLQNINPSIIEG